MSKTLNFNKEMEHYAIPVKIDLYPNIFQMVKEYQTIRCPDLTFSETINKIIFNGIN